MCSKLVKMRLKGSWGVGYGNGGVFEAAVLVLVGAGIVGVCKRFVRIDNYQVGCTDSGVGEVGTKTGVEYCEDSVEGGVDSRLR